MKKNPLDSYTKYYEDICFTRSGLFRLVADEYKVETVIYPGCSFHITPALFFPHVMFIDKSEAVQEFFTELDAIKEYVNSNKKYRRSSYIQYLQNDYKKELPNRDNGYEL